MSGTECTLYALFADALYAFKSRGFGGEIGLVADNTPLALPIFLLFLLSQLSLDLLWVWLSHSPHWALGHRTSLTVLASYETAQRLVAA